MVLSRATTKKGMRRAVGEQSREWHSIEPVTGGCMVRSCAPFLFYANHTFRPRFDADMPQGQPQAVSAVQPLVSAPTRLANDC